MSKELQVVNENAPQFAVSSSDAMLAMIERVASNPDADIAKMERLMDMRDREFARLAEIEFNIAFSAMQPELPIIEAKGKGHNNSKHAKKEDMNIKVNPVLAKHGFSLSFTNTQKDKTITTRATLRHRSGHSIFTELTLADDTTGSKNVVQAVGSSQSYGERYTMKAILNLTISDDITDDDGGAHGEYATDAQRLAMSNIYQKFSQKQKDSFDEATGGLLEVKKDHVNKIIAKMNKTIAEKEVANVGNN